MPLTGIDKIKLGKYIKEHANGDMYYFEMCDYLGKRGKITHQEFLDYFTDCIISEFSKDGKISVKNVSKLLSMVAAFLGWIHEENLEINEETLDKIRSFDCLYEDYLTRTGMECDKDLKEKDIVEVIEIIDKLYPSNSDNESLAKYFVKEKELETKIKELERTLKQLETENTKLQSDLDNANTNLTSTSDQLVTVRDELREKKQFLKVVEKQLEELNIKLTNLEAYISDVITERDELLIYKNKVEELSSEISKLESTIREYVEKEKNDKLMKQRDEKLKSIIYQELLVESASVSDLLSVIESKGLSSDVSEIGRLLREMRSKVNIVNGTFSRKPTYKIIKPKLMANGKFYIDVPCECKHMDVMLVSDFHIKEFDKKILNGFDMINDYCVENGISLILNLGDFYDGFGSKNLDYDSACKNYKLVEESIDVIPKAEGIYHAVMGGNHERNISSYGFNPLKMLVEGRDDFIDLGYYHSTICLDGTFGVLGKFDLHHPSDYDFPVDLDDEGLTVDFMNDYLEDVYTKYGRSRDDSYIDIFGHTHRNQFNYASGYCYIPTFFEGKSRRGACHLRIYFDEDTGIKYMVFMPLSVSSKLVKNNEIVYQKVLSR